LPWSEEAGTKLRSAGRLTAPGDAKTLGKWDAAIVRAGKSKYQRPAKDGDDRFQSSVKAKRSNPPEVKRAAIALPRARPAMKLDRIKAADQIELPKANPLRRSQRV